jgi:hypothetical protein
MTEVLERQARELFDGLQEEFSQLHMVIDPNDPNVECSVLIPKQPGLDFDTHLNLQNGDELHLNAGDFWCSWFPCSDLEVVTRYREAVVGILSGRYRILEYRRWGRVVKADLQAPDAQGWKTVAKSRGAFLPVAWGTTTRELRNGGAV